VIEAAPRCRPDGRRSEQRDYVIEELVAESVALSVRGLLGLDTAGNSMPYLTVWSEDTQPDAFERIAALVDRLARRPEHAFGPGDGEARARRTARPDAGRTRTVSSARAVGRGGGPGC
jgi:hypothetical protein